MTAVHVDTQAEEPNGEALTEQLSFGYALHVQRLQLELNDDVTRNELKRVFEAFMARNKEEGTVASYSVVCSQENNPPSLIVTNSNPSIRVYWTQTDAPQSWVFMFERGPFYEP